MAAVNIVAPIFMVATGIGLMFGIGASVIASIRLSEKQNKSSPYYPDPSLCRGNTAYRHNLLVEFRMSTASRPYARMQPAT